MRVIYVPHNQKTWEALFKQQALQSGHGMLGFQGTKYQRGAGIGNLFSGLFRSLLPVAKSAAKAVGKEALSTGVHVASDALEGRNIREALKEHSKTSAKRLLAKGAKKLNSSKKKKKQSQKGHGVGYRPRTRVVSGTIKGQKPKKPVSRKKRKHRDQLGVYFA